VQGYRSPDGFAAFTRARELGEQLGSTPELLLGVFGLWQSTVAASELGAATELADQLDALATREGSALGAMWANVAIGTTRFHRGPHTGLDAHWERTLALYDATAYRDAPIDPGIQTLGYAAVSAWHLGDGDAMRRARTECLALADASPSPSTRRTRSRTSPSRTRTPAKTRACWRKPSGWSASAPSTRCPRSWPSANRYAAGRSPGSAASRRIAGRAARRRVVRRHRHAPRAALLPVAPVRRACDRGRSRRRR
jgi:transcriptional regulator with XRE-family HTH domain